MRMTLGAQKKDMTKAKCHFRDLMSAVKHMLLFPVMRPLFWFQYKMIFDTNVFDRYEGFVIGEFGPRQDTDPDFVQKTKETLDFLKKTDARRFRIVQSRIKAILNSAGGMRKASGSYERLCKCCTVKFKSVGFSSHPENAIKKYASLLVHEATHGTFNDRQIPYNSRTKKKIEWICTKEMIKFSRLFHDGKAEYWKNLFTEIYTKKYGTQPSTAEYFPTQG